MRLIAFVCAAVALSACQDRREREKVAAAPAPALTANPENDDAQTGAARGNPPLALPSDVRDVEGTVARAGAGEVVVRPAEGEAVTMRVGADTPVRVDGRVARAEEIPQGARVRAAYTLEDGDPRAVRIDAERAER
jgi:hypothetical protein